MTEKSLSINTTEISYCYVRTAAPFDLQPAGPVWFTVLDT